MKKLDSESVNHLGRFDPLFGPVVLLGALLVWSYWPTFTVMQNRWSTDPRYAHGYLVPLFSLVLLWLRRERLANLAPRSTWGGLVLILIALTLRLGGTYIYVGWVEAISLLPALAGYSVLARGWPSLRWAGPAVAFLIFMVPLPYRVEGALASPLQRMATNMSTYALQTLDFPAVAEGNVIRLERGELGVVEACSGLSMLFTFFAMTTGLAMVIRRPWLDKVAIVTSAIPIALLVNTIRITTTGVCHELGSGWMADQIIHDLAGWLMMPMAMGLLWLEVQILSHLLVAQAPTATALNPLELTKAAQAARDQRDPAEVNRHLRKQEVSSPLKGLLTKH